MNSIIDRIIRPEIKALNAYSVPPPQQVIKLDAMENPYHWPLEMREKWQQLLAQCELNRYPSADQSELKAIIRSVMKIPAEQTILLGNGSDELIQILALACAKAGASMLTPEPGFAMYKMIATYAGMEYIGVPLSAHFELDMPAMRAAIQNHQPAIIFIAYPNNPTGNLFTAADIKEIIKIAPGLVVIDEAYHPFANSSFMSELGQHDNLLVMRTLSKLGLAGLRLGILSGPPAWINEFEKVRMPYNINSLSQTSAEFALTHHEVFSEQAKKICTTRDRLFEELQAMPELTAFPSSANFILFRIQSTASEKIFQHLLEQKILIKNMGMNTGLLKNCLRVTIGTDAENSAFLAALKIALKK